MSKEKHTNIRKTNRATVARKLELENLRAEIWKLAATTEDESALVQSQLNMAGPVMACQNISFMPYDENQQEIIVKLQWRADGQTIGLGDIVPQWIFKRYMGQPYVQFSFDQLPRWLQPVLKIFQKKYGTQSSLVIPYGDPNQPDGYITVNNYTHAREYTAEEIELFIELAKIIHLRSRQLQDQAAVRASEERYRQIFETNHAVKLIINPADGRIVEANQAAAAFYGYERNTLAGMRVTDIYIMSEAKVRQAMAQAVREEQLVFNFRHRLASGKIREVEVYSGPFETAEGTRLYSIIHDITDRHRAEQARQNSEERLAQSLEHLSAEINDRKQIEQELRSRERFVTLLNDITYTALETANFQEMLQLLADRLAELIEADGCYLTLWDEASQTIYPTAAYGPLRHTYPLVQTEPDEVTMTASVLRAEQALVVEDVFNTPHVSSRIAAQYPARSLLGLPLIAGDRKLGAALIAFNQPHHFTAQEISFCEQAARQISLAVANANTMEALRQSQEQYKSVVTNVKEVIFQTDAAGLWTFLNPAWTEVTEFSLAESIGKNFLDYVHPDDRQRNIELFQPLMDREKDYCRHEIRYLTKSGGVRWIEVYARLSVAGDGHVTGTTGTLMDITNRKQAEQSLWESRKLLDALFSQALDGIFFMMLDEPVQWDDAVNKEAVLDYVFSQQRITRINRAMLEQYRATEEQLIGQTPQDFFAHDLATGRAIWRQFFDEGRLHIETDERRFDGSPMWIEGDYICLYDHAGRITGHFGIQRDVTEQVQAREQIKASLQEKEVLLKEIHHRVKNNLQIIASLLYLQSKHVSSTAQTAFQESRDRIRSMALIHEQLYQSSNLSTIDFRTYLNALLTHLSQTYRSQNGPVKIQLQAQDVAIEINTAITLGLIINELVSNAFKHAFPEKRTGEIKVELTKSEPDTYHLIVSDNGVGLSPQMANRLAEENLPSLFRSSMGMQLVDTLTRQLEGKINVHNDDGVTFEIIIPISQ